MRATIACFATFVGWACAFLGTCILLAWDSPHGGVQDMSFLLSWTLMVSAASGVLVGLPFVVRMDPDSRWLRPPVSMLVGGVLGVAAYLLLIGWWAGAPARFVSFAAAVGAIALPTHVALAARCAGLRGGLRAGVVVALLMTPPLAFIGFTHVMWPALASTAPAVAYQYGSSEARDALVAHTLRTLEPGVRLDSLSNLLPDVFPAGASMMLMASGDSVVRLRFTAGRLASVVRHRADSR